MHSLKLLPPSFFLSTSLCLDPLLQFTRKEINLLPYIPANSSKRREKREEKAWKKVRAYT